MATEERRRIGPMAGRRESFGLLESGNPYGDIPYCGRHRLKAHITDPVDREQRRTKEGSKALRRLNGSQGRPIRDAQAFPG
jgi:hypothetical protein